MAEVAPNPSGSARTTMVVLASLGFLLAVVLIAWGIVILIPLVMEGDFAFLDVFGQVLMIASAILGVAFTASLVWAFRYRLPSLNLTVVSEVVFGLFLAWYAVFNAAPYYARLLNGRLGFEGLAAAVVLIVMVVVWLIVAGAAYLGVYLGLPEEVKRIVAFTPPLTVAITFLWLNVGASLGSALFGVGFQPVWILYTLTAITASAIVFDVSGAWASFNILGRILAAVVVFLTAYPFVWFLLEPFSGAAFVQTGMIGAVSFTYGVLLSRERGGGE